MTENNNFQKVTAVLVLVFIGAGILVWMAQPEPTVEEMTAKAELLKAEAEATALEIQAQALVDEMERGEAHKRKMELEAIKTPEERVTEAQAQNSVDAGEAVIGAVGIGAAAYLFGKMLEI